MVTNIRYPLFATALALAAMQGCTTQVDDPISGGQESEFRDVTIGVLTPDEVVCSSELVAGNCTNIIDGASGTCGAGEWQSDGEALPWVELRWNRWKTVERLDLFDTACGEQIVRGHVEFSDGSPDVHFGALDDTGTTPTFVDFSPRAIKSLRVVVDEVANVTPATPNPGFGEIVARGNTGKKTQRRVLVLNFDPYVESGVRLHEWYGWNDPTQLSKDFANWVKASTNRFIRYKFVGRINIDEFPVKADGFQYDAQSYDDCMADSTNCHPADLVDYDAIFAEYDLCARLDEGEFDQVWLFGGPYFGYWEAVLAGEGAYDYNAPPLLGTSCSQLLPVMGFSYERGLEEMVHNLGHATEGTMGRVFGSKHQNSIAHPWDRFWMNQYESPDFDYSGCGSIHFAPNSEVEYAYDSTTPFPSYCADFDNYPNLAEDPSTVTEPIDCNAWGCTEIGHLDWWFNRLPHDGLGLSDDGRYTNWWRYVADPNAVLETDAPSASSVVCSSEYATGWCEHVQDGQSGTCNVGEWATAGVPTGSVTLTWDVPTEMSGVTLWDRACGEQVTNGTIEFGDGSAPIAFGALEDTGTVPTEISFAPRVLSSLTVNITGSTGANPGLGEIAVTYGS